MYSWLNNSFLLQETLRNLFLLFIQVMTFWLLLKQHLFQRRACFLFLLNKARQTELVCLLTVFHKGQLYMFQPSIILVVFQQLLMNCPLLPWTSLYVHNNLCIFISLNIVNVHNSYCKWPLTRKICEAVHLFLLQIKETHHRFEMVYIYIYIYIYISV